MRRWPHEVTQADARPEPRSLLGTRQSTRAAADHEHIVIVACLLTDRGEMGRPDESEEAEAPQNMAVRIMDGHAHSTQDERSQLASARARFAGRMHCM